MSNSVVTTEKTRKVPIGAIIGALGSFGKKAPRQLIHAAMVVHTLAALAHAGATAIGARTLCEVLFQIVAIAHLLLPAISRFEALHVFEPGTFHI